MKSEPDVYSIADLARDRVTAWCGVRNYQARNFMRDVMRPGDLVLFYHSSCETPGVAGVGRVAGPAYADPTQFDRASPYFDAKATRRAPVWMQVDVAFEEAFPRLVPLEELRADPALKGLLLLRRGNRLSVLPVTKAHFERIRSRGRDGRRP